MRYFARHAKENFSISCRVLPQTKIYAGLRLECGGGNGWKIKAASYLRMRCRLKISPASLTGRMAYVIINEIFLLIKRKIHHEFAFGSRCLKSDRQSELPVVGRHRRKDACGLAPTSAAERAGEAPQFGVSGFMEWMWMARIPSSIQSRCAFLPHGMHITIERM